MNMLSHTIRTNAIANAFENAARIAAEVARNGGPVEVLATLAIESRSILEASARVADHLAAIDRDLTAVEEMHLCGHSADDIIDRGERNRGAAGFLARSVERTTLNLFLDAENHSGSEMLSDAVYSLHMMVVKHASDVADTGRRYIDAVEAEGNLSID